MKNTYEITIIDQKLRIKSNESQDFIQKIENYLNQKIEYIRTSSRYLNSQQLLTMALLTIGEELFKINEELSLVKSHTKENLLQIQSSAKAIIESSLSS